MLSIFIVLSEEVCPSPRTNSIPFAELLPSIPFSILILLARVILVETSLSFNFSLDWLSIISFPALLTPVWLSFKVRLARAISVVFPAVVLITALSTSWVF